MLTCKLDSDGSAALLIKGARRVGKSTLAKIFAEQEYRVGKRYLIYTKDLRNEGNMTYLPAYMTLFL